ncbi:MAG: division/cell wall cluster transcriptional repressor MraZ [Bacillota bacterium]
MFLGQYVHNMDEKGRVAIPARFRTELGDRMVVTRGLDKCLWVYPWETWRAISSRFAQLPFTRARNRNFQRYFFAGAVECSPDAQGRILISPALRTYAGLTREVVVAGVSDHVEIWDRQGWEAFEEQVNAEYEEIAESLFAPEEPAEEGGR